VLPGGDVVPVDGGIRLIVVVTMVDNVVGVVSARHRVGTK